MKRPAFWLAVGLFVPFALISFRQILLFGYLYYVGGIALMPQKWGAIWTGALALAGTVLLLVSLRHRDADVSPQPYHALVAAFLAMAAVTLAAQPAWFAPRAARDADAALDALLAAIGSEVRPETMYPGRPPVAEADDPVAALDAKAIVSESASFTYLHHLFAPAGSRRYRRHPLVADEMEQVTAWLAAHTNFTAAADAISATPDYRSCLQGPASLTDSADLLFGGTTSHNWARRYYAETDPRIGVWEIHEYAELILFRAVAAIASGDAAAGPDAFARIENLSANFERQPPFLDNLLVPSAIRRMEIKLLATRIDLWDEESLCAFERAADSAVASVDSRIRDAAAGEVLFHDQLLANLENNETFIRAGVSGSGRLAYGGYFRYMAAAGRRAFYRNFAVSLEAIRHILAAMATGEPIADALESIIEDEHRRFQSMPPLGMAIGVPICGIAGSVADIRTRATLVHTAVAVERFRRKHGAPPSSLDALVPDYLPAIPRDARTGDPLSYNPGPVEIPEESVMDLSGSQMRTLPAQTLPGFSLTLPYGPSRAKQNAVYDFITSRP